MSLGKLNTLINIISTEPVKDSDGFVTSGETIIASVRAYFEQKNSTERWRNMSQSGEVNALFRIRCVPGVELNTRHVIICEGKRYNIYSVENVRNRNMYLEILAQSVSGEVNDNSEV